MAVVRAGLHPGSLHFLLAFMIKWPEESQIKRQQREFGGHATRRERGPVWCSNGRSRGVLRVRAATSPAHPGGDCFEDERWGNILWHPSASGKHALERSSCSPSIGRSLGANVLTGAQAEGGEGGREGGRED